MNMPKNLKDWVEEMALEYSSWEPKNPLNGLNMVARDQFVGFLAGAQAIYQKLLEESQCQELKALETVITIDSILPDYYEQTAKIIDECVEEVFLTIDTNTEIKDQ